MSSNCLVSTVGVTLDGEECSQYSEAEMQSATATPTIAPIHVELWKITAIAMQSPRYTKYRVKVTY